MMGRSGIWAGNAIASNVEGEISQSLEKNSCVGKQLPVEDAAGDGGLNS